MNAFEIAELFINAAHVDTRLPIAASPKKVKCAWVPFVHTEEDIKSRSVTRERKEQLIDGDDPFNEWLREYWDDEKQKLSRSDVANWERCNEFVTLVSNESNRRCLWAWAQSKVDALRIPYSDNGKVKMVKASFAAWCKKIECIHEETGRRRKDRALLSIEANLARNTLQNNDNCHLSLLPTGVVGEHISDTIAADAPKINKRAWMADNAFSSQILADGEYTFEWAAKRNEIRRQKRAASLRKQAA